MVRKLSPGTLNTYNAIAYVDPQHPITKALTDTFGGYATDRRRGHKKIKGVIPAYEIRPGKRAEIVSETLCDDVITYLAPTLEPYKGCTIIDVHPGACLWSSKLHDYLKPKHHLLMEPEQRYFEPFIKPLLNKRGSTYHHTLLTGAHPISYWDNYRKLLNDPELLPSRPLLDESHPQTRQIDTSILLTGNLWRQYHNYIQKGGHVGYERLVMQHMSYAALANDIIHKNGLVRMLWWLPEESKNALFNTNTRNRSSFTVGLSLGASVTEVVGANHVESQQQANGRANRSPVLDAVTLERVRGQMAKNKMEVPKHRLMQYPTASSPEDIRLYDSDVTKTACKSVKDLAEAATALEAYFDSQTKELGGSKWSPAGLAKHDEDWLRRTISYPQSMSCIYSKRGIGTLTTKTAKRRATLTVDNILRVINLECNFAAVAETHPNDPGLDPTRQRILALGARQRDVQAVNLGGVLSTVILSIVDDIHSLHAHVPLITRDARQYEPLQADKTEFWPNYDLALVDLVPKRRDISVPEVADRAEASSTLQQLIKHIFYKPTVTVAQSLESLAPNAAQDLLPAVPALRDARVGGRLDPGQVHIRMMSEEAIVQLCQAFLEWPFRPSKVQMALATEGDGSQGAGEEEMVEGVD